MAPSPFFRKFLIVLASIVCVFYLAYRVIYTLNLSSTYATFASIALYVAELYGIFNLFLFFLQVWEVDEPAAQPPLEGRTVDVLVPTFNEDVALLRATLEACVRLQYPHRTYVLDDGRRPEVETLARELGVNYISRPDNRHFKAGNLNYAFERTDGEFVVVLDADHVPEPHFISRLIGYFRDERIGYVQTPHAFYNFDSFQARLDHKNRKYWEEGHLFYYVIQPGRNHWGCPIFAGSAAMFRRTALKDVGFIATETITEDMHTGLRMNARGWRSIAITERLVAGQAAPDITTFHSQRLRWGTGNLSIMKFDNPLFMKGLSLPQRLCYLGSMLHWSSGIFKLIIYLTPIAMLFSGIPPVNEFTRTLLITTLVYLFVSLTTMKVVSNGFGSIINSELFSMVNFWTQIKSTFRALLGYGSRIFNVTPKGAAAVRARQTKSVWPYIRPQTYLIILSVLALFWGWGRLVFDGNAILAKAPGVSGVPIIGPAIAWLLTNLPRIGFGISDDYFKPVVPTIWVLIHFWLAYKVTQRAFWPADKRYSTRHVVHVPVEYEPAAGSGGSPRYGVTVDLNDTGMAVVAYERFAVGDVLRLVIRGAGEVVKCKGEIRSVADLTRGAHAEGFRYGIQFLNLTAPQTDAINRICLHYGVPRMYAKYDKNRGGVMGSLARWQERGMTQRRHETRNEYHLPLIVNTGTTEETAQFTTTEDVSRTAISALLENDIASNTVVGYLMSSPVGDVRGTARVIRTRPESLGGKTYHRAVMEFAEFEGQGRTTLQSIVNPGEARPLTQALKPDRRPTLVRMGFPTLVVILIAIPLVILQFTVFKLYHKDDFTLRDIVRRSNVPGAVLTEKDAEDVNRIYAETMSPDKNPSNDRLVLLMAALKAQQRGDLQLDVAKILAGRNRNDLSLQQSLIYAHLKAGSLRPEEYVEAETTYNRLLERRDRLRPDELLMLNVAGARVAEQRGDLTKALERYKNLYETEPNLWPEGIASRSSISLRQEYAGVLIKARKYEEAAKVLGDSREDDFPCRKLLVATHLLHGRSYTFEAQGNQAAKLAEEEQYNKADRVISDLQRSAERKNEQTVKNEAERLKADLHMARGSWTNAQEVLKKLIDQNGGDLERVDSDIVRRMGQALLGNGDHAGAIALFTSLIDRGVMSDDVVKGYLDAAANKEAIKALSEKDKEVIEKIYQANQRKPMEDPIYIARLGWVLQRVREFDKSEIVLENARKMPIKDNNLRDQIQSQLADILIESGKMDRAAEIFGKENSFKGKEVLASLYLRRNELKKAEMELKSLIAAYPPGQRMANGAIIKLEDVVRNEKLLAKVLTLQALDSRDPLVKGSFTPAIEAYERLETKYPNDKEIPGYHAFVKLWLAERTKDPRDFQDAIARFQTVLDRKAYVIDPKKEDSAEDMGSRDRNLALRSSVEQGLIDSASYLAPNTLTPKQVATFRELANVKAVSLSESPLTLSRLAWVLVDKTTDDAAKQDAVRLLEKALALNPTKEEEKRELAGVMAKAGQFQQAAAIMEKVKKSPEDRLKLARIYSAGRQWKEAVKELRDLTADRTLKPEEARTAELELAKVVSWSGDHKEAVVLMDKILAREPDNLELRRHRADVTLWAKDYDGAADQYLVLVKQFPNDADVTAGFANAIAKSKKPIAEEAMPIVRRLTELAQMPENKDALLAARLAEVYAAKLLDDVKAKQLAIKSFRLNPENPAVRKELGYVLAHPKLALYREADVMLLGTDLTGEDRKNYVFIASQAENFEAARRHARLYLQEQKPNTTEERAARRLLADVLTWKGDYEEALAIYEQLLNENRKDRELRINIADVTRFWQNYPVALEKYAELLSEEFENAQLWIGFIDAASSAPKPMVLKQRALLTKVHDRYAADLQDPRRMSRMAWVMLMLGEGTKANALLSRAVASDPKQPAVRKELAGVLAAADRRVEAIEMLSPDYVYSTLDIKEILNYSDLLTAESQLERAEKELAKFVDNKSERFYRVRYASVLLWNGKYVKAREVLGQLVADFPNDFEIRLRLAQSYLWAKEYPSALRYYTDLLSVNSTVDPKKPETSILFVEKWLGFVDAAAGTVGESLREFPRKDIGPLLTTAQRSGIMRAYDEILQVRTYMNNAHNEELARLKEVSGESTDPLFENRKKALQNRQAARFKNFAESTGRLGLLLGLLGDRERATNAFGAALAIDRLNRDVWLQYAQTLTALGDDARAKLVFDWLLGSGTQLPTPGEVLVPERNLR